MFAARYFCRRYFAPRYFPKIGHTIAFSWWWLEEDTITVQPYSTAG